MNDLFASYVNAALLVVIAVFLTLGVVFTTGYAAIACVRYIIGWFRTLPARKRVHQRATTDAERFREYAKRYSVFEDASRQAPDASLSGNTHTMNREAFAAYFSALSDEDIASLARGVNFILCGGTAPVVEVEAFLCEERERICASPVLADTHLARLMNRFAPHIIRNENRF